MTYHGERQILAAVELLWGELEAAIDNNDRHTLDDCIGRVLDAMRDNRAFDQSLVTPYVVKLVEYRRKHARELYGDYRRGHFADGEIQCGDDS
jgi:hypothetical protein